MSAWEDNPAIVLDNGTGMVKAGYAGDEIPKAVFPAAVAHARSKEAGNATLFGDDAINSPKGYTVKYPVEHGIVVDWDDMERIWNHCFTNELSIQPSEHAMFLTEAPLNPRENREKMAEVLFERFEVPAMQIHIQAVLTLYATGRTDGVVLDIGDGVTHIVPVFHGHSMPMAVQRMDIAGRDLTEWMMELLSDESDRTFTTTREREMARILKETHCYVSQNFESDMQKLEADPKAFEKEVTLPDGTTMKLGKSQFCCPELLFDPQIAENPNKGLPTILQQSILGCEIDIRKCMYGNIVLSGGTTMLEGLESRLLAEIKALCPTKILSEVKVIAPAERKYSVWIGGAILSNLSSFMSEWITKSEYEEVGSTIVHDRCSSMCV